MDDLGIAFGRIYLAADYTNALFVQLLNPLSTNS